MEGEKVSLPAGGASTEEDMGDFAIENPMIRVASTKKKSGGYTEGDLRRAKRRDARRAEKARRAALALAELVPRKEKKQPGGYTANDLIRRERMLARRAEKARRATLALTAVPQRKKKQPSGYTPRDLIRREWMLKRRSVRLQRKADAEEHGGEAALKEAALAAHQTRVVARKARGKETEGDVRRAMRRDARRSLKQQRKLEALQDQEK
jgi:hypothetical protein